MTTRRPYQSGNCQDCGHPKLITWVTFWVNGMRYRVCKECIKPYRKEILTGETRARMLNRE